MNDLNSQISQVVSEFVASVTALARRAAVDGLTASLEGTPSAKGAKSPVRDKGAKRDADQLQQLQGRVLEYVAAKPGMRIEQINKDLGTSTRDLQLPIRKLVASGELKTKGEKRATTYFAGARKRAVAK